MTRERGRWFAAALALTLALVPALAEAQGAGRVTGRVVDQASNAPISQAQIVVVGTTLGARTNEQGEYTIVDVPAGDQQLRVLRLGFASVTRPVTVVAGQSVSADFSLQEQALTLDAVVTTATGEQQRTRESGAQVSQITTDDLDLPAITNFSEVLTSRAAGVSVQTSGGTTGNGARIRIRGSNSISLSNDPIIIIDGIRVNNESNSTEIGVGGQQPSRFNDLNPEDIENIEIIKGPAAAALYGTAAANGVIQVTTKRGQSGKTVWNAFAEGGNVNEITAYPTNYAHLGLDTDGEVVGWCTIIDQADGACTPVGELLASNPLEDFSPFRTGYRTQFGVSASGGSDRATYYIAGDHEREQGVYAPNLLDRTNLRVNLTGQLREDFRVQVSTGYLNSNLGRPQNDNNTWGIVSGGLLGTPHSPETNGYYLTTPDKLYAIQTTQDVDRFTTSFNANWNPISWLTASGTAGIDWTNRDDILFVERGIWTPDEDPDAAVGFREVDPYDVFVYTGNANVGATFLPMPDLTSQTQVGLQWTREETHGSFAYGQNFTPGIGSLEGANELFSVGEETIQNATLGALISQQFGWRDRLFLTAAVRTDNNSAFGTEFGWVTYPALSLSWVIGEEAYFPQQDWLTSLRLRAAYGESGQRPSFRDATTFFSSVTAAIIENGLPADVPALIIGGTGNVALEPERSAEVEVGFDAGVLRDRARLEFTYYHKTTQDALVAQRLAPSLGASNSRFANIGEVQNTGVEGLIDARILESDLVGLDFTVTASRTKNELIELGENIAPIIFGLGGDTQRHQEGYPLGGYWQRPYTYNDDNGDGILGTDEVEVSPNASDAVFLGTPFPKYEVTFRPRVTILNNIQVSALLDHRGGHKLYNATGDFRCASFTSCIDVYDPNTPLELQARAVAAYSYGTVAGYIEDASFTKLREVAVEFRAPSSYAQRFGVSGLSLTVAGRNLATWTDYTGLDPELNYGAQLNFNQAEFLTQPPVRYYTARVNLTF